MSQRSQSLTRPNGAAAAALLSGAIGAFAMGLFALSNEWGIFSAPTLYGPAGGVSGRTTFAVVVWLIVWAVLHRSWRAREMNMSAIFIASLILIALGLLGAFPPVWHLVG